MPCPLFLPQSLLPLSDIHMGACFAEPEANVSIEKLTACCNPGHARSSCARAATHEADSVRLLVRSDEGGFIEIAWATERNHHPLAVGTLRLPRAGSQPGPIAPLEHQARACAARYLHHTGQ